jgi:hypothetical protein
MLILLLGVLLIGFEEDAMKEEKSDKNLSDKAMAFFAEDALKKAVARTIADHKRTGDPIVIWRDGKVIKVPAKQIEVREPEAEYGNPKENGK